MRPRHEAFAVAAFSGDYQRRIRVHMRSTCKTLAGALFLTLVFASLASQAQTPPIRGVYTPGFSATNSGVLPEPGFTYSNTFLTYSFDQVVGPNGNVLSRDPSVGVLVDANVFIYVPKKKILGGNVGFVADLNISNSSIDSVKFGTVAGGAGFADSFFQPITMGWHLKRADISAAYAFFAPTGRFTPGATNNTGSGHWTNAPTAGETIYLTKNKATAINAYQMLEFHTTQTGTNIHPGSTFDLDYSVTQILPLKKDKSLLLQPGFMGYGQWQLTDNTGPTINPTIASATHYAVNSIGVGANIILPARKASLGFKWFNEISNQNTVQGNSFQINGGITF
jgi:hypothetical protein